MKDLTNLDDDFDFGFSAMSEEELRETEKLLAEKLNDKQAALEATAAQAEIIDKKLKGMRDMIMPLLKNLMANPDKEYIYWPQRTEKIKKFIEKMDNYIND